MRLTRLAYLLLQHPFHLHRALVRRGLALKWIDEFRPFWDRVRPASLPITDYTSYQWLCYHFTQRAREKYPEGDHFEDMDWQYARLLSYVLRREMHPLRMLKVAWVLRGCKEVLEFGAGAAPYAYFIRTAWPLRQMVYATDIEGTLLRQYQQDQGYVDCWPWGSYQYDAIVCTEVFEHLSKPYETAEQMMQAAQLICFDYVDDKSMNRALTLSTLQQMGDVSGPDKRGLYVWRKK